MIDPLQSFFHPRGVAVIGASGNPAKLSYGVLHNLVTHGYRGLVYPVNPKGGEMMGLPVYPSVVDVPDPVDLAVIVLSADRAVRALKECGQRGVKTAVIIASGFAELGAGGREREAQLREVARQYGMRFIGPNCVGVVDTYAPIDTSFIRTMPGQGVIGFVSHSGAVCGGTMDWASAVGVGFSRIISLGNQVDVDVADALDSLAADPHTRVVAAYVEGLPGGRRFIKAARQLTPHKPLVVLKAGQAEQEEFFLGEVISLYTVALFAMYALIAVAFRSYWLPLLIMTAIPFGFMGAVYGHLLFGIPMAMFSYFGIGAAAGVVVNDNLVLVDYIGRLRESGKMPFDAVEEAGVHRFRPILLTTVTTFVGLLPIMAERSIDAEFLKPAVLALAFGVLFALFVTLLMVPALYCIGEDIRGALLSLRQRLFSQGDVNKVENSQDA